MTTSARSATPPSPFQYGRDDERRYDEEQREDPDDLPSRERARVIAQLELLGTRSHRDRQERVVTTQDLSRVAIDADPPIEVPVLRDEHVARITWCRLELDRHLPGMPRAHAGVRTRRGRQRCQRPWVYRSGSRKQDHPVISGHPRIGERRRNQRISPDFYGCGNDACIGRRGVGFVEVATASGGGLDGAECPVVTRNAHRIGEEDKPNG